MRPKRPVKDIQLNDLMTVDELVCQMKESGGFTGRKVSEAADIVEEMLTRRNAQHSCHSQHA